MPFSHDTTHALDVAVDFLNATPASVAELRAFVHRHGISDVGDRLGAADVTALGELRQGMLGVFGAEDSEAAAAAVNALVSGSRVTPRLTDHDDWDWHIHYFTPGASLAEHLAVDGGMALAHVLAAGEGERLRRCAAPDCDHVLVDLSRNRSKRYCDARTCGNRLHVAAYRERQRASS